MKRTIFLSGIAAALIGIGGVAYQAAGAVEQFAHDTGKGQQAILDSYVDQM